jgi:HK97 family phage portal protein
MPDQPQSRLGRAFSRALSWAPVLIGGKARTIEPRLATYNTDMTFDRMGHRAKGAKALGRFTDFGDDYNPMAIPRPNASKHVDPARALNNYRGYAYAGTRAIAREVMNIDFRLFQVNGKNHKEMEEHELLDVLDSVNSDMTGPELKFLTSTHLDLTGNAYWLLFGVKNEMDAPKAIYLLDPSRVSVLVDKTTFPYQIAGYRLKLEGAVKPIDFKPYEILHFRDPDPTNPLEGVGAIQSIAAWIDVDNYAMEFNRKFFVSGARPAGFLETEAVADSQVESIRIGFTNMHEGMENMQRIAVLPKGVKWASAGSSPKDMDFKNLSENSRDRILAGLGVSKTILGTAESDTNRATAETADYVFSKRVVRPRMQLICSFLNEKLVPRYGDNLYITFIDPVPEDKAFRTTEMQTAVGSQPVLTANEAREEYMGLGPIDGGDVLMRPGTMKPITDMSASPTPSSNPGDISPDAQAGKATKKTIEEAQKLKIEKAANGERVAFRPPRTKLAQRVKKRQAIAKDVADKVANKLRYALEHPTKKFERTPEELDSIAKDFNDRVGQAESKITEAVRKLNASQRDEVIENLSRAVKENRFSHTKDVDPTKLFDLKNWIKLTVDAFDPILSDLYESEGKWASSLVGEPINPLLDPTARASLSKAINLMSESYNTTTLTTLETKINEGLAAGQSLDQMTQSVKEIYEWSDTWRAERVAKTEAFRTANAAQKEAWKQSGVVKTLKWYTNGNNVCPFCAELNGKVISIDDNFANLGDTISAGEGDDMQTMSIDYSDISAPPLHPNCNCQELPEDVSLN